MYLLTTLNWSKAVMFDLIEFRYQPSTFKRHSAETREVLTPVENNTVQKMKQQHLVVKHVYCNTEINPHQQ